MYNRILGSRVFPTVFTPCVALVFHSLLHSIHCQLVFYHWPHSCHLKLCLVKNYSQLPQDTEPERARILKDMETFEMTENCRRIILVIWAFFGS